MFPSSIDMGRVQNSQRIGAKEGDFKGTSKFENNENVPESFLNRPTTALMKVIDKFSSLSGLSNSGSLGKSSGVTVSNGYGVERVSGTVLASQLQHKVDKIIRLESKVLSLQAELSSDMFRWAGKIPNADCDTMVKEFGFLLQALSESSGFLVEKFGRLKMSLKAVQQREKKLKDQINARNKNIRLLRDSEIKNGPSASTTTLLNEKLEELTWNLDVLEQHYIRSISKDLRESLIDVSVALQTVLASLSDATAEYFNCLFDLETSDRTKKFGSTNKSEPSGLNSLEDRKFCQECLKSNRIRQMSACPHTEKSTTPLKNIDPNSQGFHLKETMQSNEPWI